MHAHAQVEVEVDVDVEVVHHAMLLVLPPRPGTPCGTAFQRIT
jgi:hypothetical protein